MNYKNEKYDHIKNFWKISQSDSALFQEFQHCGFNQCDIAVIHAIRKFDYIELWFETTKEGQRKVLATGLPNALHKHMNPSYARPEMIVASIRAWEGCGFIKPVNQIKYPKGRKTKVHFYYEVDIARMKNHLGNLSANSLF